MNTQNIYDATPRHKQREAENQAYPSNVCGKKDKASHTPKNSFINAISHSQHVAERWSASAPSVDRKLLIGAIFTGMALNGTASASRLTALPAPALAPLPPAPYSAMGSPTMANSAVNQLQASAPPPMAVLGAENVGGIGARAAVAPNSSGTVWFDTADDNEVVELHTLMRVPPAPAREGTLFLWPGLQPRNGTDTFELVGMGVLQSVLAWGPSSIPNQTPGSGNYSSWYIGGQYVNPSLNGTIDYGGGVLQVQKGDVLGINIWGRYGTFGAWW